LKQQNGRTKQKKLNVHQEQCSRAAMLQKNITVAAIDI
jgi:hypothetical protein